MPKLLFRFSLRAANSLATSIRQSLSVLCLWVLSIVRLLNIVCVIVERSHVFTLQADEKDLSLAALVAGFTRRSLHMVMISLIIRFLVSESFTDIKIWRVGQKKMRYGLLVWDNKSLIRRFVVQYR